MFKGTTVALVTPFTDDGKIDYDAYKGLLEFHLSSHTTALLIGGTTGESPSINDDELEKLFRLAVAKLKNHIPLLAGTGTNNTKVSLKKTMMAKETGMDAALIVVPYYNKPPQDSLYQHYEFIAKKSRWPIILYNVPGRTGVNISPDTVAKLSKLKNIIGIKEASGSMNQAIEIKNRVKDTFLMLSGDDLTLLPFLSVGGHGVVSVSANLIPKKVQKVIDLWNAGKVAQAQKFHNELYPLHKAMFVRTNPVPVKTALYLLNMVKNNFRLPLTPMPKDEMDHFRDILIDKDVL